jgi:hypothetical protein
VKFDLHSFVQDAKRDPKQPLNAGALDRNFRAVNPLQQEGNNAPYKVTQDEGGWKLEPTLVFDVCENGKLVKYQFFGKRLSIPSG